ncbi:MAG TPA: IclR family transcriptional regulator C-terminal domain-containing protein [Mycobacterium sp.]
MDAIPLRGSRRRHVRRRNATRWRAVAPGCRYRPLAPWRWGRWPRCARAGPSSRGETLPNRGRAPCPAEHAQLGDRYSTDEGEYLPGTRCVAVPLLDDGAGLIAALSVTAPSNRIGENWPAQVLAELRSTAATIRGRFGHGSSRQLTPA